MTLGRGIKLEPLIAGQHSPSRGNGSDHMNDKQALPRLWHLSSGDHDKHSSVWQAIHSSGTSMFMGQADSGGARACLSSSAGCSNSLTEIIKASKSL